MKKDKGHQGKLGTISRRKVLGHVSAGVAGVSLFGASSLKGALAGPVRKSAPKALQSGHNILFVFTDQERYFSKWPAHLSLPGHERLQRTGVTYNNHYIGATMCTSSRSIMLTGLQTPDTKMYENLDLPWVKDLSTDIPTIGHMMRQAGYYSVYKGKWHLTRAFDQHHATHLFTDEMEKYGFSDYASPGDMVGHALGGFQFDDLIAGSAKTWLRRNGLALNQEGKPWFLTVGLVNPHDVMYLNTDDPGKPVQGDGRSFMQPALAPNIGFYKKPWDVQLPANLSQSFDEPGRPKAHGEFAKAWDFTLGHIPPEQGRWRKLNDFYLNSIRAVDNQLRRIFDDLDALGMTDKTIIVFTADHGEMAGAHGGLRGKGPLAYQETMHVPLYIVHPDVKGGQKCDALTSHIDLVPSFLSLAGADATKTAEFAGRNLPGKDFTSTLTNPGAAKVNATRDAVLFTYSALATVDSALPKALAEAVVAGKDMASVAKSGFRPNLQKRGNVRSTFDGRYKFSRYFAPIERNKPTTLDELYAHNDVELYDLKSDPHENKNLAADRQANAQLIATMSAKLEAVISAEMGVDDGREMPNVEGISWQFQKDRID